MGAQGSMTAKLVPRSDSRGEAVIPWALAQEMEQAGLARIKELESQLAEERGRVDRKEDELAQTQRCLAKLEGALDRHAQDSQFEQTRLSRMEETLAQERSGTEEKVGKLILAVAGEKHRAELAEQERDGAAERAAAEWGAATAQLRERLAHAERLALERGEQLAELRGRALQEGGEAEGQLVAAKAAQLQAENRAAEKEAQFLELQQQRTWQRSSSAESDATTEEMVHELQRQVTDEMNKRMEVQQRLLEKDRQLREALTRDEQRGEHRGEQAPPQQELAARDDEAPSCVPRRLVLQAQERLAEEEQKRIEAEDRAFAKEAELRQLQQQLADELKNRRVAMEQVAERELKLSKLRLAMEGDDLTKQQALQGQVIEKELEVCELQQQLADELSKRQAVQYKVIEKERVVCDLQQQLMRTGRRDSGPSHGNPLLVLPTHREEEVREVEPDDEKSPRSDIEGAPRAEATAHGWEPRLWGSSAVSSAGTSGSESGGYTAQPPRWGSVQYTVSHSPAYVSHSPVMNFRTTYAGQSTSRGAAEAPKVVVSAGVAGGAAMRNRAYLPSSGGYARDGLVSGATSPSGRDRQRRIILASKTFG